MDDEQPTASAAGPDRAERAGPRRYGLLLVATVLSLGVQGIVAPGAVQQVVVTALAGASVLLALRAAEVPPSLLRAAAIVTLVVLAVSIVHVATDDIGDGTARLMNAVLLALGPPAVAVGVVRDVRGSGRVRVQAVMGVLSLYLLVGMLFGFLYGAIDRFGDNPLFTTGELATVSECLYFSFTTLTTVGYGDLVTSGDLGHTLAVLEALTGQIYLVTVVSLIVGNLRPTTAT
jgi:hypothetical protein